MTNFKQAKRLSLYQFRLVRFSTKSCNLSFSRKNDEGLEEAWGQVTRQLGHVRHERPEGKKKEEKRKKNDI